MNVHHRVRYVGDERLDQRLLRPSGLFYYVEILQNSLPLEIKKRKEKRFSLNFPPKSAKKKKKTEKIEYLYVDIEEASA